MAAPVLYGCQNIFTLEVSTDGSAWVDLQGEAVAVDIEGGEQPVGTQLTAGGEYALVCGSNKIQPYDLTFRGVYTEDAAGGWTTVHTAFLGAAKALYARWSPLGGGAGKLRFNTSTDGAADAAVPIVRCTPPALDAGTEGIMLMEFVLRTPALYQETIAA